MDGQPPAQGISQDEANAIFSRYFAPWVQELDLVFEHVGRDETRIRMPLKKAYYRHGGLIAGQTLLALADTVMVFTVFGAVGRFQNMATINQSTNFMKPISNADVIATGRVLRLGKTMAFGEILLAAEGGSPAVQVQSTCALLEEPKDGKGTPS